MGDRFLLLVESERINKRGYSLWIYIFEYSEQRHDRDIYLYS